MCKRCNHCDNISYGTANETDRQHGNRNTNRQLIHCNINSSIKSKAISSLICKGKGDEQMKNPETTSHRQKAPKTSNQQIRRSKPRTICQALRMKI
jgi:hypothetical protein